jgi:hypothetical protein
MNTGVSQIRQRNEALLVMRRFVELSALLLPYLERMTRKKRLSKQEKMDKQFIHELYDNYDADPTQSTVLFQSEIIPLILKAYTLLKNRSEENDLEATYTMNRFYKEYERLMNEWNETVLN